MRAKPKCRVRRRAGFTLTELAVVLAIVGLLLGGLLYTLAAQVEQRNREDTQRRLEEARDLLVAFALVNGRLPCPAPANATGDEAPSGVNGCGTGTAGDYYPGFLPGRTIGAKPVDSAGYALDSWGNRIRYAVSATSWGTAPFARFTKKHVASDATASWDISQTPQDGTGSDKVGLVVCSRAPAPPGKKCDSGTAATNNNTVVAIVLSTGKNGIASPVSDNEQENQDADWIFVDRPSDAPGATSGEFDDMLVWIPVGLLYSRMISAGILP